jgi:hypothetical protein
MGYAVYEDCDALNAGVVRWAGYGVPAVCDHPGCSKEINRGLDYKCERRYVEDDDGDEIEVEGCGLYFCVDHSEGACPDVHDTYAPKPDTAEWERWMLTDESWATWRQENPELVGEMQQRLSHENA